MRRLALLASILVVALASAVQTGSTPPDAAKAVADARAQAKREGKNVLVVFHASWCNWCKRFDKMLDDPKLKPAFEKSYVVLHLDVLDQKALENPGGEAVMEKLGGKDAGLPFYAVVAPDGKKVGDSLQTPGKAGTNTGHPSQPNEIAHFMALLKTTAKKTSAKSRGEIETYLKAGAKA